MSYQVALEYLLDLSDPVARREALRALAALPLPTPAASENLNLHFHSFFSYNAEGWSPSHIAWAAHRAGLYAAGLCDFDVLDGQEEFLQAGELLGLRATVNVETRAYVGEYADAEITSPGEPGVTYVMGAGFARPLREGSAEALRLADFRQAARTRNVELVARINPHLPDLAVDYEADVLPLTPLGGATERHLISAYVNKARAAFASDEAVSQFWSGVLGRPPEDIRGMLGTPALEELVRSKLVKQGGFGYVQPSPDTFPPIEDFMRWVAACGAVPMITWLDGISAGERNPRGLLECLIAKGGAALNIIPDRNWNLKDPATRELKIANLRAIVAAAEDLGLPLNIGTEMNKAGLPFVDDLSGAVLAEFRGSFLRGARIMVGHSVLARYAGRSYATCGCEASRKNALFESVGALPPVTSALADRLVELGEERAFAAIKDAAAGGQW